MNILALDTTTSSSSIAVYGDNGLVAEYNFAHKKDLSSRLMKNIENMLKDSGLAMKDLDGIGVSIGPGSFTGLRIGIVTAKSLAQALDIPVAGICTLDLLAHQFSYLKNTCICPIIRVRKGEAYYALFSANMGELIRSSEYLSGPVSEAIEQASATEKDVIFCGDALEENMSAIKESMGDRAITPSKYQSFSKAYHISKAAYDMIKAGKGTNALSITPMYLRKSTPEIRLEEKK